MSFRPYVDLPDELAESMAELSIEYYTFDSDGDEGDLIHVPRWILSGMIPRNPADQAVSLWAPHWFFRIPMSSYVIWLYHDSKINLRSSSDQEKPETDEIRGRRFVTHSAPWFPPSERSRSYCYLFGR